jgi:hypothetical protein
MTRVRKYESFSIQSRKPVHLPSLFTASLHTQPLYDSILPSSIAMQQYFPTRALEPSDDVILAPKLINPKADDSKDFDEFRLYGKQYMRCKALTKKPKSTK